MDRKKSIFDYDWEEIIVSQCLIDEVFNAMGLGTEDEREKILSQGVVKQFRSDETKYDTWIASYTIIGMKEGERSGKLE